jgi:hypothetical protein
MSRVVVLTAVLAVCLAACAQPTPSPSPSPSPTTPPTLTPGPTQSPTSRSDERFKQCFVDEVLPPLNAVADDMTGFDYAWRQDINELLNWLERLERDADETREHLQMDCALPNDPQLRQARELLIDSMREYSTGAARIRFAFTEDTLLDPDHDFEPGDDAYAEGFQHLQGAADLLHTATQIIVAHTQAAE